MTEIGKTKLLKASEYLSQAVREIEELDDADRDEVEEMIISLNDEVIEYVNMLSENLFNMSVETSKQVKPGSYKNARGILAGA